jgi:hypothetical protein
MRSDFVIASVARDHTVPDPNPKVWNLWRLGTMATMIGLIAAAGGVSVVCRVSRAAHSLCARSGDHHLLHVHHSARQRFELLWAAVRS